MHYYLRCSAVMPFCRRFWCGFDGLCGLVNTPNWKPSVFWMSLVTPHDIIHDWELITYHCHNLCNGGDIDWNMEVEAMFEIRIWEENTTFVGGMPWVCYKDILWFIGVLRPVLNFLQITFFWSCFPCFCMFCFVLSWEEKNIKLKQKYIFAHIFNRGGL